jgi:hypothetical protein
MVAGWAAVMASLCPRVCSCGRERQAELERTVLANMNNRVHNHKNKNKDRDLHVQNNVYFFLSNGIDGLSVTQQHQIHKLIGKLQQHHP